MKRCWRRSKGFKQPVVAAVDIHGSCVRRISQRELEIMQVYSNSRNGTRWLFFVRLSDSFFKGGGSPALAIWSNMTNQFLGFEFGKEVKEKVITITILLLDTNGCWKFPCSYRSRHQDVAGCCIPILPFCLGANWLPSSSALCSDNRHHEAHWDNAQLDLFQNKCEKKEANHLAIRFNLSPTLGNKPRWLQMVV